MAAVLVKYMGNMGTLTKSMVNFNKCSKTNICVYIYPILLLGDRQRTALTIS